MKNNKSVKHWEFETIVNITLTNISVVGRSYQAKIFNQNHKKQILLHSEETLINNENSLKEKFKTTIQGISSKTTSFMQNKDKFLVKNFLLCLQVSHIL